MSITGWVNSETPISYSYDYDDLITGAGSLSINRDPKNGLITGTTLDNLADSRSYDAFGELTGYKALYNQQSCYYCNRSSDE